jgi:hypothetical protein
MPCSEDQTVLCASCENVQRLEMELDRLRILSAALAWPWPFYEQNTSTQ